MYHNVLHVLHDVLVCLTMFYDVWRVVQRSASPHRRPPIASDIATMPQGSAITPQKLATTLMWYRGERDIAIAANVIPCYTPSWMGTGVTLFLEDNFRRGLQPPLFYVTDSQPITGSQPLWCHSCYINNTVAPLEKPPSHNSGLYWICLKLCRF